MARSAESRQRAHGGGADVVERVEDLPSVDGLVVATPTTTHAAVVRSLLRRQVPIFVEKPLTLDSIEAEELVRSGDLVFVMDKWRYHPGVVELARIAKTEELGPVVGLQTARLGWANPHDDVDAVWVLTPHDLAIGLEIFGRLLPPHAAVAEMVGNVPVGLMGQCGQRPWHLFEVSSRRRERRRSALLHCRDGIVELNDSYSTHVVITRGSGGPGTLPDPELRAVGDGMPLCAELQEFVRHLAGGPAPKSGARDGAAIVRALSELRRLAGVED